MKLKDKHYINLKWITLIALPAISASVGLIGGHFNLVHTDDVVFVMNTLAALVGTLIGVSSVNYNKEK